MHLQKAATPHHYFPIQNFFLALVLLKMVHRIILVLVNDQVDEYTQKLFITLPSPLIISRSPPLANILNSSPVTFVNCRKSFIETDLLRIITVPPRLFNCSSSSLYLLFSDDSAFLSPSPSLPFEVLIMVHSQYHLKLHSPLSYRR